MNLRKLFEMQRVLDNRIYEEHPELKDQNNLSWKVLALQVELGECANEWRGFKKWSHDQEPRTLKCIKEPKLEVEDIVRKVVDEGVFINPLLEEYVDCLHFILSIGLELKKIDMTDTSDFNYWAFHSHSYITEAFSNLMFGFYDIGADKGKYVRLVCSFIGLGEMLGFTWEQIEQAYISKNQVNHERQNSGY